MFPHTTLARSVSSRGRTVALRVVDALAQWRQRRRERPTAPAVATIMVGGGTALVANGATGGLVMGEQTVGDLQVFGSTGDGTGTTLVFNTPVAVNVNELVVAGVGNLTGSSGLLEVTLHYSVRR